MSGTINKKKSGVMILIVNTIKSIIEIKSVTAGVKVQEHECCPIGGSWSTSLGSVINPLWSNIQK